MKTIHAITSVVALFGLTAASHVEAATGAFDGAYDLNYELMNMGVQCGYAAPDGTVAFDYENYLIDLSEEEALPEDVFDAFLQQRLAQIEAADLGYYQEQAAKANAYAFFTGLRLSLDGMIQAYPDALQVSMIQGATQPTRFSYAFNGHLSDADGGGIMDAAGAMNYISGDFLMQPAYVYGYGVDNADQLHVLSYATQLGGNVVGGYGALRWQVEKMNYDQWTGEVWGCGISNLAGIRITGEEAAPSSKTVAPNAYKLDAKSASTMKARVHQAAVRDLAAQGVRMNGKIASQAAALGKGLTR